MTIQMTTSWFLPNCSHEDMELLNNKWSNRFDFKLCRTKKTDGPAKGKWLYRFEGADMSRSHLDLVCDEIQEVLADEWCAKVCFYSDTMESDLHFEVRVVDPSETHTFNPISDAEEYIGDSLGYWRTYL